MIHPSPTSHRTVLLALLLGLGSAAACIDDEVLENEECFSDDDCFKSQECNKTGYQLSLENPVGWCRAEGGSCATGSQPGCGCESVGLERCCTSSLEQTLVPHELQDGSCICVLDGDSQFLAADGTEAGCYTPS